MHMDAAGRSESSLNSLVWSMTKKDFVLLGSDEGFSRPELVPYEKNTQETLDEVYNKLSFSDLRSAGDIAAERKPFNQKDYNSRLLVVKQSHNSTEGGFNKCNSQSNESPSSGSLHKNQLQDRYSSGTSDKGQSNHRTSSRELDTDQSNRRPSSRSCFRS